MGHRCEKGMVARLSKVERWFAGTCRGSFGSCNGNSGRTQERMQVEWAETESVLDCGSNRSLDWTTGRLGVKVVIWKFCPSSASK